MKTFKLNEMTRGWFVGGFEPTAFHTKDFEVAYQLHKKGTKDDHYHTLVTEINLVVSGKMQMHDTILEAGDIFILEPWEITNSIYFEDTAIVCVKTPSLNDKRKLTLED